MSKQRIGGGERGRSLKAAEFAEAGREEVFLQERGIVRVIKFLAIGDNGVCRGRSEQRPESGAALATGDHFATFAIHMAAGAGCHDVLDALLQISPVVSAKE